MCSTLVVHILPRQRAGHIKRLRVFACCARRAFDADAGRVLFSAVVRPAENTGCGNMGRKGRAVLSRRTVAKYRDELHIPSTAGRKQYETSGAF